MFGKKASPKKDYDRENLTPAVRSSICTGEKTAGFVDERTGKFTDVMLIKSEADMREFMKTYGIDSADGIKKIY